jgi:hypothetical protein
MLPKGIHAALYADDLVLWCSEEYATTATYRMQQALNKITEWKKQLVRHHQQNKVISYTLSKTQAGQMHIEDTPSNMKTSRRISE